MTAPLTTLARVKLRIAVPATADDLLTSLIDDVSDWITEYTGRLLTPLAAQTFTVDTSSGSVIRCPFGIRAVTALGVASSDQPDAGGTYTAVALADVVLRPVPMARRPGWPATKILILGATARLVHAVNGAQITADVGFEATPAEISAIADDAVVTAYQNAKLGTSGVIGADDTPMPAWATMFGKGSPQMATLRRYRGPQGVA